MNRLSFLKKFSVGVAAAVITPKILLSVAEKKPEVDLAKPPYYDDLKSEYGGFDEPWVHNTDVNSLRLYDMCIDRDSRAWICTAQGFGSVELRALESEPQPNLIDVEKSAFADYFIIMGNALSSF